MKVWSRCCLRINRAPEPKILVGGRGNEFQLKATKVNKPQHISAVRVRLSLFSAKPVSIGDSLLSVRNSLPASLSPGNGEPPSRVAAVPT